MIDLNTDQHDAYDDKPISTVSFVPTDCEAGNLVREKENKI